MTAPASPAPARVAVIVPAYGVAHLLHEALDSLLAQTMTAWECVVIDDGAPDDVAGAVAPYLSDPRISFLATDNRGVSAARNRAIATTKAPVLVMLDGDDRFRPHFLATTLAAFEAQPDARLLTCNAVMFGALPKPRLCFNSKQGTSDGTRGTLSDVLDRSFGIYIGSLFRRADYDAVGGFDEEMTHAEDLDLWVRLMLLGGVALYHDDVLCEYRVRATSASASAERMLLGNIRVYEKAQRALPPEAPEQDLLVRLVRDNRAALEFEYAIDRIVGGDVEAGLAELRRLRSRVAGPIWALSFGLWSIWPQLAPPMLRWRRQSHSRGGQIS